MRLFTRVELGRRQPHLLAPMALGVFPAHLHRLVWQLVDLGRVDILPTAKAMGFLAS